MTQTERNDTGDVALNTDISGVCIYACTIMSCGIQCTCKEANYNECTRYQNFLLMRISVKNLISAIHVQCVNVQKT